MQVTDAARARAPFLTMLLLRLVILILVPWFTVSLPRTIGLIH